MKPEAALEFLDLDAHRARIGGVALEHLDSHRAAVAVAQQGELDLERVALAVARIAALGQRATAALTCRARGRTRGAGGRSGWEFTNACGTTPAGCGGQQ